jgi:uncharacterized protein (TIGR02246 family)
MVKTSSLAVVLLLGTAVAMGLIAAGMNRQAALAQREAASSAWLAAKQAIAAQPGAGEGDRTADRAAVQKAADSFIKAFDGGDPKAVASFWTDQGEFIAGDDLTLRGRAAIEKAYVQFFTKYPKSKVVGIDVDSLRFVSRDSAVMEGHLKVLRGQADQATTSKFTTLYVREDGKWLMAVVREWPSGGDYLRDLEWMIGRWATKGDGMDVDVTYEWEHDKAFIRSRFTIKDNAKTVSGSQMIGKDPATGTIRSWSFESDGGFGEAIWGRDGKKWVLEASGVLGDGGIMTATNILTPIDNNSFTWQSVNRAVGDNELPDVPPVRVTRVK